MQALRARRRQARIALGQASAAGDVRKIDVRLQRLTLARRHSHDEAWRMLLARQLDARARKLRARLEGAGVVYVIEPLHEVRIAGKRLRYALELVGDTRLAPVARLLRQLTQVQDVLGHLHDLDALMAHLRATVASAPEPSDGSAALDHLDNVLERERRTLHAAYLRRRASLIVLADSVRDDIVARVGGDLTAVPEARAGG
jgi:CHAD domain-containing protein